MKLAILGSGSRGNAIAVTGGGATLLVDAGFGGRSLMRRAAASGIALERVTAVVLTHEHGDHARGAVAVATLAGCPIYASRGTLAALRPRLAALRTLPLPVGRPVQIGPLIVTTCRISHDAAEPLAVAVEEPTVGTRIGIAYDVGCPTAALRRLLQGCVALVMETNHDDALLQLSPYPASVRHRIAGDGGHLSNREAAELLAAVIHPGLRAVVLAHLSDRCNQAALAREAARQVLAQRGFRGTLLVASQDEPLPVLDLSPAAQLTLLEP